MIASIFHWVRYIKAFYILHSLEHWSSCETALISQSLYTAWTQSNLFRYTASSPFQWYFVESINRGFDVGSMMSMTYKYLSSTLTASYKQYSIHKYELTICGSNRSIAVWGYWESIDFICYVVKLCQYRMHKDLLQSQNIVLLPNDITLLYDDALYYKQVWKVGRSTLYLTIIAPNYFVSNPRYLSLV